MPKFQLIIDLGGTAAMQDNHDVAKALRGVADRLSKFASSGWSPYALDGKIVDDHNNTVGTWEVKPDVEWNPIVTTIKAKAKRARSSGRVKGEGSSR